VGRAADGGSSRALIGHSSLAWGCESCERIRYAGLLQARGVSGRLGSEDRVGYLAGVKKCRSNGTFDVELEMRQFAGDVALTS